MHGVGGLCGLLLAGLLATTSVNALGANGLRYGGGLTQLGRQGLAALVTIGWSVGLTFALGWAVNRLIGPRVPAEHELTGIDEAEHAESAYETAGCSAGTGPASAPGPPTAWEKAWSA